MFDNIDHASILSHSIWRYCCFLDASLFRLLCFYSISIATTAARKYHAHHPHHPHNHHSSSIFHHITTIVNTEGVVVLLSSSSSSLSICSCYFDGFTVDLWAYCSTLSLFHLETLASPDPILATTRGDIAALDLTIIIIVVVVVVVVPVLLTMLRYYFLYKYNGTNKH